VKSNRRADIGERLIVRVTFPNDNATQADRIGDVAVLVFLDDQLDRLHGVSIASAPPAHEQAYSTAIPSPHAGVDEEPGQQEETECGALIISTGPRREETIVRTI
jgi:hypothetical protein